MNLMLCYFLLQLIGLYSMLLVLDYLKKPGSRYLEEQKPLIRLESRGKWSGSEDKAA